MSPNGASSKRTTVLVIGAGLSGLSAAKLLTDHDVDVTVLEARGRVGGRTFTVKNDTVGWVDLGGAYVGPTQNYILRLAHELGVDTYKVFDGLKRIHFGQGKPYAYKSCWAHFGLSDPLAWFDINYIMHKMDKMMKEIPVVDPWDSPHADEWDAVTLQHFFEKESWTRSCRDYLSVLAQINLSSEPSQVSLLWALWYIKGCGGLRRMWSVANGGEERKFENGSMTVSERLLRRLKGKVEFDAQVCRLQQDDETIVVGTIDGREFQADYVIMAIPLSLQLKIHYDPPLPPLRNQLIQRTPVGCAIKANIYYARPFWREIGYNGCVTCCDQQLVFNNTTDDCKPGSSLAALTLFAIGDNALRLQELPKNIRPKVIAADLAKAFRHEAANHPVHYEEKNWLEEQYSGGCYVCTFPTGVLSKYGKTIREPFGRVYFAGTETATSWPGYMNGAVQAGERSAREALHALKLLQKDQVWIEEPEFTGAKGTPFELTFLERHPPHVLTVAIVGTAALGAVVSATAYGIWKAVGALASPRP